MDHLDPVDALAITPDGLKVATVSWSSGMSLWDAKSRSLIGWLRGPAGPVPLMSLAPDGRTLATGGLDRELKLWELDARLSTPPIRLLRREGP